MKKFSRVLLSVLLLISLVTSAQPFPVDSIKFFSDERVFELTLTTDIKKLQQEKKIDMFQDASVNCSFPDSSQVNESIQVCARGHFRRDFCSIPPLMLNFRTAGAPKLASLGKLKLVIGCGNGADDEQLLLKEYLVYKIYNLLEQKSFRVRLAKVNYRDSRNKIKPFSQHAFLIEDDNDMAERNGCIKQEKKQVLTESTDRELMTKVAVFEYMISNGDWSVPNNHN